MMKNDYAISYDLKSCTGTSKNAGLIGNIISRSVTQIMKKAIQVVRELWKVRCVIYLDDLLKLHQDKDYLKRNNTKELKMNYVCYLVLVLKGYKY
jgi:hypothetical protein